MGKRRVEPEHIQRLRKRAENARDLGLTPRDWAATELGLASFQAQVLASFRPDAQEYVRHAILRTEFEQVESDRRATEVALVTETQLAVSLDSQLVRCSGRTSAPRFRVRSTRDGDRTDEVGYIEEQIKLGEQIETAIALELEEYFWPRVATAGRVELGPLSGPGREIP